jgi:hypothetical protein
MQKIPMVLAVPGMVLAQDIKNEDNPEGPPLCGKGVSLTGALISRLNKMGIQSLAIEGHPVNMGAEKSLEEELKSLDRRFKKVDDDPIMKKLKETYRIRIIKSAGDDRK